MLDEYKDWLIYRKVSKMQDWDVLADIFKLKKKFQVYLRVEMKTLICMSNVKVHILRKYALFFIHDKSRTYWHLVSINKLGLTGMRRSINAPEKYNVTSSLFIKSIT